jgi:hypothetical protein
MAGLLTIEPPADRAADEAELVAYLHPDDAAELAAGGHTAQRALQAADEVLALRWQGELVALLGCQPAGGPGCGVPWMLSTTRLGAVPQLRMARALLALVNSWRTTHHTLANLVHVENRRAVRLVQWLGFDVMPDPIGPGKAFRLFCWERGDLGDNDV